MVAVGALIVLAGIAGLIAARRRKTTKFEDSIISGTDIKTNTVFGSTGGGVVNTGDNSLASDFSREGLGNIDTDEVDPIAEAEVYLAYGRDAQAEEILKDALKKDSQRQEIYLKLLEIHAQHNKPSAFETVASELYSVSGGQGETWQKAMALGRQLDPEQSAVRRVGRRRGVRGHRRGGGAAAEAAQATRRCSRAPPQADARSRAAGASNLDFTLDEDISLAPSSGVADARSPAAIFAARLSREGAVSRRSDARQACRNHGGRSRGDGRRCRRDGQGREREPSRRQLETVSFEPESIPKFDLDFQLDEPAAGLKPDRACAEAGRSRAGART